MKVLETLVIFLPLSSYCLAYSVLSLLLQWAHHRFSSLLDGHILGPELKKSGLNMK